LQRLGPLQIALIANEYRTQHPAPLAMLAKDELRLCISWVWHHNIVLFSFSVIEHYFLEKRFDFPPGRPHPLSSFSIFLILWCGYIYAELAMAIGGIFPNSRIPSPPSLVMAIGGIWKFQSPNQFLLHASNFSFFLCAKYDTVESPFSP
jgi:hypothetical protein